MIRSLVTLILLVLVSASAVHSQGALLPHGYFPKLDNRAETDTIYGSRDGQQLGWGLVNIGPAPDSSYGSLLFTGLKPGYHTDTYKTGPGMDLHHLQKDGRLKFNLRVPIVHIGPIHHSKSRDLVTFDQPDLIRVYWEGDDGTYDSLNYSELRSRYQAYEHPALVVSRLVSDTVEDILFQSFIEHPDFDSLFADLALGGNKLYSQGQIAYADSSAILNIVVSGATFWRGREMIAGDFRGVGAQSVLMFEQTSNVFCYQGQSRFSLQEFARHWDDTLFSAHDGSNSIFPYGAAGLVLRALPGKLPGDSSKDLVIIANGSSRDLGIYIFKGGPDFGSHRLMLDSAAFVIPHPSKYDKIYDGLIYTTNLHNCGDMTGTGNPVVSIACNYGTKGYVFFYVLGQGLNERASMYLDRAPCDHVGQTVFVDTLTANGDKLQDIAVVFADYASPDDLDAGKSDVGTLVIVYGSKKIPIANLGIVHEAWPVNSPIRIYPNPARGSCILAFDSPESVGSRGEVEVHDMLGRLVHRRTISLLAGSPVQSIPLSLPELSSGLYHLSIQCGDQRRRAELTVAH